MRKYIVYLMLFLFIAISCDEKKLEPITGSLGKPAPVTDIQVENIPGGAIISYKIPNVEDILGVKGVYQITTGATYEASSSFYENKLEILGYNDTQEHKVELFTYNRAQELSNPVVVTIQPLESPLSKVVKTVNIISDFGGAQFNWVNELKAPLTFEFLAQDSLGNLQTMRIVTSEADTARQSLRGYEPEPRVFATIIRDHWDNKSDTIFPEEGTIIPMYEEKLDKSKMNIMKLGNDQNFTNWEGMDSYIIDDDHSTFGHSPNSSLPAPFTIDLGVVAKLSRVVMFQRFFSSQYYNWGNPKKFTIYGKVDRPSQSGDWSEWTKIMDCEIIKPSDLPVGTVTDEDMASAEVGHEFVFELTQEPLRYLRFVVTSTWGGTTFTHPADVDVYGEVLQ
ncbi:MAG: DUF5000 domain-containing lipoprotein [Bacteroidota bacterium]|jgi:hypothetical protein|nr:DUF5000 domain-containing lipoprotein [Bacteroidota bacterium]HHU96358.1 DUF4959 domain-containing protein [Petrimonas sp.]